MGKYVRLYEDVGDSIAGGYADTMKQVLDTKTAAIENEYAVDDPNAGEGRRPVTQNRTETNEDTTNPPSAQQVNGEELLANDDLSNFSLPLTNNESVVGFEHMSDEDLDARKKEAIRRKYSTKLHKSEKDMAGRMVTAFEQEQTRRKHSRENNTGGMNEKQSPKLKSKMKKTMHEFGEGKLKSGNGHTVTDPKQAVAIAYSEAGESKNESESILRFEQFVVEKYGPEQVKLNKKKQDATQALVSTTDKADAQKKVSQLRKDIAKSVSKA